MATARVLSLEVRELIARVSVRIVQTDEIVAITRALAQETRHIIRSGIVASKGSDSLSYENDCATRQISARREPVQS